MIEKVRIDYGRLCAEIARNGKTNEGFSLELGRSRSYISNLAKTREQPKSVEQVMCILLGLEPGSLIEADSTISPAEVKVIENIFHKLGAIEELLDMLAGSTEKLLAKANANTVQIEKIKDCLKDLGRSDHEKACEFLKSMLAGGRMNSEEVILKSEANGIKRADLMKAKRDLQVDQSTTGYGKNQKTWWFIPS